MKNVVIHLIAALVVCIGSIGCQSTRSIAEKSPSTFPPLSPPPDWIAEGGKQIPAEGAREIRIEMKFIELSYEASAEDIPLKRYEKRLTEGEAQDYLKTLSQRRSVDLMSAPSVVTSEGRTAHLVVGSPFRYLENAQNTSKLTEAMLGVSSYVRASLSADGQTLTINVFAETKELKSYRQLENGLKQPLIETRRLDASAILADGENAVFGGLITIDQQDIENKIPFLGDIPIIGQAFRQRSTLPITRELIVMVRPKLVPKSDVATN